jgi:hypothetical protein
MIAALPFRNSERLRHLSTEYLSATRCGSLECQLSSAARILRAPVSSVNGGVSTADTLALIRRRSPPRTRFGARHFLMPITNLMSARRNRVSFRLSDKSSRSMACGVRTPDYCSLAADSGSCLCWTASLPNRSVVPPISGGAPQGRRL